MKPWIALVLSLVVACGEDDGKSTVDAAPGGADAATGDASIDAPAGPPNAQIVGTWNLMSPSTTCNISFADGFEAAAMPGSDHNFTLTLNDGNAIRPTLACALSISSPGDFTCSNFSQSGTIPPNCSVTLSIAEISGTVVGNAVEIQATVTVTSPNCGQALNCGPLPHVATGTIE